MVRWLWVLVVLLLLAGACGDASDEPAGDGPAQPGGTAPAAITDGSGRGAPQPDAPVAELTAGLNDVGFDLLRREAGDGNLVFSPSSIGHALLMARAAADDATRAAIDTALRLPAGTAAHEAWNATHHAVEASAAAAGADVAVSIADRIWPRLDVEPSREWVHLLAVHHGVDVQPLDFAGDPVGSRRIINDWVGEETEGLIRDLLPDGFIEPMTVLVLTDALYLKARWERPFGKYGTEGATFTRLDGSTVPVELMRELELDDRRGLGDGFVGAEVPYAGGDLSMLVIVPDDGRFDEVRHRLDQALLDEIDATFTAGPFELLLPGWDDDTTMDLLPWLREVGAAPGSYPGIGPGVFLDAAVHGADITVDEWGTVAAAATAFGFAESGPPEPELTVRADRPFLYLIRHRPTGLVLFAGQVTDPT